jgi:hypothetical protein
MLATYGVALFAAGFSVCAALVLFRAVDHFDNAGK